MNPPRVGPAVVLSLTALLAGSVPLKRHLAQSAPAAVRETFNPSFALQALPLAFLNHRIAASQWLLLEAILYILKLDFPHYHLAEEDDNHHSHAHAHPHKPGNEIVAWTHGPDGRDLPLTRDQLETLQQRERELTLHMDRYLDIPYFYDLIETAALLDPENRFILAYGQSWVLNPSMAREMVRVLDTVHTHTGHWRPAFDAGWLLLFTLQEPEMAATRFQQALADPAAPAFVRDLLARTFLTVQKYEMAVQFLLAQLHAATDHDMATRLERQLAWTMDLLALNRAARAYHTRHGHPIASLEDLVRDGLLRAVPEDKMGQGYAWDPERQEVFSQTLFNVPTAKEESPSQEKTIRSSSRCR